MSVPPLEGDCLWPIEPGVCCDLPDDVDPTLIESAVAAASAILRRLSGDMIGLCRQTLRPLHQCPTCRSSCCGGADGIGLTGPNGEPVAEVLSVSIGPDQVDPATWRFDGEEQVLWRSPPDHWPTRDVRWQECGEGGAFCVEVLTGTEPDAWALRVGDELVCELVKSCIGAKCRIPRNATTVSGRGITVQLEPMLFATMIPEVSGWLQAVNPHNATAPAAVWSPDTDNARMARGGGRSWLWR